MPVNRNSKNNRKKPAGRKKRNQRASFFRKEKNNKKIISGLPGTRGARTVNPVGHLRRRPAKLSGRQVFLRSGVALISMLVILTIAGGMIWTYLFSGMEFDRNKPGHPTDQLTNPPPDIKDITNILLLGTDSRNPEEHYGLSDTMIILTIDRISNQVKMTSILRDCYTYIPGYDNPNRINAAHSFGGPELALRTVNRTFRMNIEKYAVINMQGLRSVINIAGGVEVNIDAHEIPELNRMLHPSDHIKSTGNHHLNGQQALVYSRIRQTDSDWSRTMRQQEVLMGLFDQFKNLGSVSRARMIQKGLSYIRTNMSPAEITYLGIDILPRMSGEIQQLQIPMPGTYEVNEVGSWHMIVDYNRVIPKLYDFIYGETFPFDPVPTMPHSAATITPAPTATPEITKEPEPSEAESPHTPDPAASPTPSPQITPEASETPAETVTPETDSQAEEITSPEDTPVPEVTPPEPEVTPEP